MPNEQNANKGGDLIPVTGLWQGKDSNGNTYLRGTPGKGAAFSFMVFPNTFKKEGSNEPDYKLYIGKNTPKEGPAETEAVASF